MPLVKYIFRPGINKEGTNIDSASSLVIEFPSLTSLV